MRKKLRVLFAFPDGLRLLLDVRLVEKLTKGRPIDARGDWHFTREELIAALVAENMSRRRSDTEACTTCLGAHGVGQPCGVDQ